MIANTSGTRASATADVQPDAAHAGWLRRGGVIMVAGPDGSGKTTLAQGLAQTLFADVPVLQVHHRRGIGRLPGRQPRGSTSEPHRHAPYPAVVSLGKVFYLFVDFLYGWLATIRPFVRSGGWVILQRDWWDLLVDPKRYRLRPVPRLGRFLGRLLPEPDLTVILEADPEVILVRKAELPPTELARQSAAWRAVRPPGRSCVYLDAARPAGEVLRCAAAELARRMSGQQSSRHAAGWVAIPRAPSERWLLPRGPRPVARTGLRVYQPVTVNGRIGWELARALSSLGVLRLLRRSPAPPRAVTELVDPHVPVGGSFAVARANLPGRFVVLIVGADGAPVAVAKVALDAAGRATLAREATNLERLGALLPPPLSAPRLLGRADGALVMEAVPWQARWRPWRMPEDVAFALGVFFRAGPGGVVNGCAGSSHGDVAPWNLLKTTNGWVLVDWEDARAARPPFYDLMHYLAQSRTLLGRPSTRELVDGVAGKRGWVGAAVAAYARGAQLSPDEAWPYLLAYLEDHIGDADRRRLLEELASYPRIGVRRVARTQTRTA
jgi:thymidylate kinase